MSQATIRAPSPTLRAVLIIVVIAGPAICFPVIKLGLAYSPALKFAGLRTLLAGLVLLGVAPLMRLPIRLPKRLWLWSCL